MTYLAGDKLLLAHTSFESGQPVHEYGAARVTAGLTAGRFTFPMLAGRHVPSLDACQTRCHTVSHVVSPSIGSH